jgi:hypothetical protein
MTFTRTLIASGLATAAIGLAQAQPVVDGSYDGVYGAALAVQDTETEFGDSNLGLIDWANGSELDQIFVYRDATHLYLLIAGNLESNYNKLEIFIDPKAGGQNRLDGVQPDTDFGALIRMAGTGIGDGLTFDTGFDADYWFSCTGGGEGTYSFYANFGEIGTTNGQYLGTTSATVGTLTGSNDLGCMATLNNSNILGVGPGTGLASGAGVFTGIEWKIPLSLIGNPSGPIKICTFINGTGHDWVSNQSLPGIGGGGNFGEPRNMNFENVPGLQYIVVPGSLPTITGTVTFSDLDEFATPPSSATFEIRDATNTTLLDTQTVPVSPSGEYTLTAPGNGQYVVSLKTGTWLRKNANANTTSGNATGVNLVLVNGDIDDDNEIAIGDYALLSSNFGGGGPVGDLNLDGTVDIGDFAILSANFGAMGDD